MDKTSTPVITENNCHKPLLPLQELADRIKNKKNAIIKTQTDDDLSDSSATEKAKLDRFKNDTSLKTHLTWFVVIFTSLWSLCIMFVIWGAGTKLLVLSDKVLISLITETLFTVLGLPLIVTRHFFPNK